MMSYISHLMTHVAREQRNNIPASLYIANVFQVKNAGVILEADGDQPFDTPPEWLAWRAKLWGELGITVNDPMKDVFAISVFGGMKTQMQFVDEEFDLRALSFTADLDMWITPEVKRPYLHTVYVA